MLLISGAFSQNLDTVNLKSLDSQIKLFINNLGNFIENVNTIEDVAKINELAFNINQKSLILIDSINEILPIKHNENDNDIISGITSGLPPPVAILNYVWTDNQEPPKYYCEIKDIRDITGKMHHKKKLKKIKKMLLKITNLYNDLKNIK